MTRTERRIARRETHAARAVPAIVAAVAAVAALAWVAVETVLAGAGQRALLLSPTAMAEGIRAVPSAPQGALVAAGVLLALAGVVLVLLALTPGRLGRHVIADDRAVVVVHDEVVGSALVRTASDTAGTDPDAAVATVGRRRATIRITPSSGAPVDVAAVQRAVDERLHGFGLAPAVRARVVVRRSGRVGA